MLKSNIKIGKIDEQAKSGCGCGGACGCGHSDQGDHTGHSHGAGHSHGHAEKSEQSANA